MQRLGQLMLLFLVGGIAITCARITVNVYFPAAEIRDAATQIEREVREAGAEPGTPPASEPTAPDRKPQGSRLWPSTWHVRLVLGVPEATAQTIDINATTPAIRQLIASRKQRYASLVPLFSAGALGEDNRGLVAVRSLDGLSLRDKAQAKTLSQQENNDRSQLYRALAAANNISAERVSEIAAIFAGVNRQEARGGWWIQDVNGTWQKK